MLTRPIAGARSGYKNAGSPTHAADLTNISRPQTRQFHAKSLDACVWLAGLMRVFWGVRPRTTAIVIAVTVLASCTSLVAFLLPLKVLLLAGSTRVPTYLSGIITPGNKLHWIVGLSITAGALYFITIFLRTFSKKLSGLASDEVMKEANQLVLIGNQEAIGRRYYSNLTTLCSDLITASIAFTAITLINPVLLVGLAIAFAIQYTLVAYVLNPNQPASNWLGLRIRENHDDFLQKLSALNFWIAFFLILLPFLTGAKVNTFVAILSFVLVRQALKNCVAAISITVGLSSKKHLVDALMLPTRRWESAPSRTSREFHKAFARPAHFQMLERIFSDKFPSPPSVRWKDSALPGVSTFLLSFEMGPNAVHYQEQVYALQQAHLLRNEDVLFSHIPRDRLNAPEITHHFVHGQFQCRVCDHGLGVSDSAALWNRRAAELLEHAWGIAPPIELVRDFTKSHSLFHERLGDEILAKLSIAVGSEKDADSMLAFETALPSIRDVLSRMPLYVSNRDMTRANTVLRPDGGASVMLWGRWSLEPIGVYLPPNPTRAKLNTMLSRVRERRSDISDGLTADHLQLAAACKRLLRNIIEAQYEAVLRTLPELLNNPALSSAEVEQLASTQKATAPGASTKQRSSPVYSLNSHAQSELAVGR